MSRLIVKMEETGKDLPSLYTYTCAFCTQDPAVYQGGAAVG